MAGGCEDGSPAASHGPTVGQEDSPSYGLMGLTGQLFSQGGGLEL